MNLWVYITRIIGHEIVVTGGAATTRHRLGVVIRRGTGPATGVARLQQSPRLAASAVAGWDTARMPLGKDLDRHLREQVLVLFEAGDWKAKRKPRVWTREKTGCRQVIEISVDGRAAPEGLLTVNAFLWLHYAFDPPSDQSVAGIPVTWSASPRGMARPEQPQWAIRRETGFTSAQVRDLAEYLDGSLLPAADRMVDPEQLLLNQILAGDVWRAATLCERLNNQDLAPWLVRAAGQVAALAGPGQIALAAWALNLSESTGVALSPDDRAAIDAKIQHELESAGDHPSPFLQNLRRHLR